MKVGYDKGRCCDECGIKIAPYLPRTRVGDQLVCGSCLVIMGNLMAAGSKALGVKVAHEAPGDSDLIFHCPFDGSGKIVGQSDGTVYCDYCKRTFTIKEEPEYPAMPQTVDGVPYDAQEVPLPTLEDVEQDQTEEFGDAGMEADNNAEELDTATDEIYITSSGAIVNERDYIRSLASEFAAERGKSGARR